MYFIFYTWADGCDEEEVAESSRVEVANIKLIGSNNRDKDLNEKKQDYNVNIENILKSNIYPVTIFLAHFKVPYTELGLWVKH